MEKYTFVKGLELNKGFFFEEVKPILDQEFPDLKYSAGLIGFGSDVLGYDTAVSMDHCWGPRCVIMLSDNILDEKEDFKTYYELRDKIKQTLFAKLPLRYQNFSVKCTIPDEKDGVFRMAESENEAYSTQIRISTPGLELAWSCGLDLAKELTSKIWLTLSEQGLLEFTAGEIYYDDLGVKDLRKKLKFYPKEVKLLKLAALWDHVGNEEAFVGRRLDVGDKIGAKLIADRIVQSLMKICFYLEERYPPYSKWFMTGFQELNCAKELLPQIEGTVLSQNTDGLDLKVANLAKKIVDLQNEKLDLKLRVAVRDFYGRPYSCIMAGDLVDELKKLLKDQELKKIDLTKVAVEQQMNGLDFTESLDILENVIK